MDEIRQRWADRWVTGDTAWHREMVNPALERHAEPWRRVLVPLCGASLDVAWLAARGADVVGIELSEVACARLFREAGGSPTVDERGAFRRWSAGRITVWQGNLFDASEVIDGRFDGVWDRGSLIAMVPAERARYAAAVRAIAPGASALVATVEYDQELAPGPPFSTSIADTASVYDEVSVLEEFPGERPGRGYDGANLHVVERTLAGRVPTP